MQHKFRARTGESFLGIVPLMNARVINEAVRQWRHGEMFQLELVPWKTVRDSDKTLGGQQILDDIHDFSLPRFFITKWVHVTAP